MKMLYAKQGLVNVSRKERRRNNYKEYSREIPERLLMIKKLKEFGFTLIEVAEMLEMIEVNEATGNSVFHKISEKIDLFDRKIKELINIRTLLLNGAVKSAGFCNRDKAEENGPMLTPKNV